MGIVARIARKAGRPFYLLYYRWLYGRRFPFAEAMARWVSRWEELSHRGDVPLSKEDWESQYSGGDWDFLTEADERARYQRIAGFVSRLRPAGSVLDVGCGEGILLDDLTPAGLERYTGVDLSEAAIEKAAARGGEGVSFVAADAETYTPAERFDVIVMNECLYYFRSPLVVMQRYSGHLEEGGIFVVSMFEAPRAAAIARQLKKALPAIDQTRLEGRKGAWLIAAYGAPAAAPVDRSEA